jgi:hypothetical protein
VGDADGQASAGEGCGEAFLGEDEIDIGLRPGEAAFGIGFHGGEELGEIAGGVMKVRDGLVERRGIEVGKA